MSAPETPPEGDAPEAAGGSWFTVARIGATVFAVLAVATVAAFFVAQKLKTAPTVIAHVTPSTVFSPPLGPLELGFGIKEDDTLTVEVVNDQGDVVRTLVDDRHQPAYTNVKLRWDGTDDDGHRVPDGAYKVRVLLRDRGRTIELPATYTVDATPPRPVVLRTGPRSAGATGPEILPLPGGGDATVRFRAPGSHRQLVVFRTGGPGAPAEVLREDVPRTMRTWRWDGKVHGRYVPVGAYVVVAESRDRAGNLGSSIPLTRAGLPQEAYARPFPGRGGITVRHVGIQPPLTPVTAGHRAAIGVDARGQRYRWALGLPGEQAGRRGTTRGTPLRVPTPGGFSGLYRLTVTSGRTTARSFVPVQGARKHPVLVVLPATTWQGRNPVDDLAQLRKELSLYNPLLAERPWFVVANKMDDPRAEENLGHFRGRFPKLEVVPISAELGEGVDALKKCLQRYLFTETAPPSTSKEPEGSAPVSTGQSLDTTP